MVRRFKRKAKDKDNRREFDIIAVLKELYEYFPEYKGKMVIPVFASLYLPGEVIAYLTKNGIYARAIKEDMMDLINFEGVTGYGK